MASLVPEVQKRLSRKRELDNLATRAEGLRVVGGMKGEDIKSTTSTTEKETVVETPAAGAAAEAPVAAVSEGEKPAEEEAAAAAAEATDVSKPAAPSA